MAKVTLEAVEQFSSTQQNQNQVGFFGLKDDGEEAVVRFLVDSMNDIDILTLHDVNVGGKYMKVSCNRESLNDNPNSCAFCASGMKMVQKAYIKMLAYSKSQTGEIIMKPCVWERGTNYAVKLREYLNNYGPLSDLICKVVRHGAKGDLKTTYEIIPNLSPAVYPSSVYIKDTSAFENYHVMGTLVKEKSNEEINIYLQTGQFPQAQPQNNTNNFTNVGVEFNNTPNYNSTGFMPAQQGYTFSGPANDFTNVNHQAQAQVVQQTVTTAPPVQEQFTQQIPQQRMPWQQAQQVQRPIRTY